jgi:thymidylate synthase (FAD)
VKATLLMSTEQSLIGECAKICYASKALGDDGKDITSSIVHSHGHLASLRFAYATIYLEGISVACQNQMVRSKHLDFMVQSKRYVNPDKGEFKFIMPEGLTKAQEYFMASKWEQDLRDYEALLDSGMKKEDARAILPANTSTKMNVTGNLQAWWSFFELRLNSHAQREIRNVAIDVYGLLRKAYPLVFTEELFVKLS